MNNYLLKTNSLTRYLNEINRFPLLSKDEEFALAVRYRKHSDLQAAHKLVTANLRFVVKIAMQYKSYGVKLRDLIQEGNIGLMTAVKKFNPEKGYRLISYAVWWIKAHIQKFILETMSLVKIGTTRASRKFFSSMSKVRRKLLQMDGKEPSDELLAKALNVDSEEVTNLKQIISSKNNSLDTPVSEEVSTTHLDLLASETPNQEDLVGKIQEQRSMQKLMKPIIGKLKEKEKFILENRLTANEPLTLQEVGNKFNISRERVRQIENNVKNKIKGYLVEKGYSPNKA